MTSAWLRGLVLVVIGVGTGTVWADTVYLKDGMVLNGNVMKEQERIVDSLTGEGITVAKANGFFAINDGARYYIFSPRQVADVEKREYLSDVELFTRQQYRFSGNRLPNGVRFLEVTDWDKNWKRNLFVENDQGRFRIEQAAFVLNPTFLRVDSTNYSWTTYFLTPELGSDMVRKLVMSHPDMLEKPGMVDVDKRLRLHRFLAQVGWLNAAESELTKLLTEVPDAKEKVEAARAKLKLIGFESLYEEVQRGQPAGRHKFVQQALSTFPAQGFSPKLEARINTLKDKYQTLNQRLEQTQRLLAAVQKDVTDNTLDTAALETLQRELSLDNVEQLDSFLTLAEQAERDVKNGKPAKQKPEELVALAVSGWLLGKNSAEAKVEYARQLWAARKFLTDYLKTSEVGQRKQLLTRYQEYRPLSIEELTQLLPGLPPPEAEPTPSEGIVQKATPPTVRSARGISYFLQLPPEYTPSRSYPLLVVLHHGPEKAKTTIERYADLAARYGFVLAAPEWNDGLRQQYEGTADEHAVVLDLIRDLKRRYQIDSDRVFLAGFGDGATMAADVGISHPDLFAGVAAMNPYLRWAQFMFAWRNAQHLPMYIIMGDLAGDAPKLSRNVFEQWMPRGYPGLNAVYRGRGMEWFGGEWPMVFDWMSRKRRVAYPTDIGDNPVGGTPGREFIGLRQTDNRFYWLTTNEFTTKALLDAPIVPKELKPARFYGAIRTGNQIYLNTVGVKQLSVWLGRGMIEFDKPINVILNSKKLNMGTKPLTLSLATMLEDLVERGDKQRPFWAKIDLAP